MAYPLLTHIRPKNALRSETEGLFLLLKKRQGTIIGGNITFGSVTLRRYYHDGKDSVLQNLPNLTIISINNNGYVSVRQLIAYFFGKGGYLEQQYLTHDHIQREIKDSSIATILYKRAVKCNLGIDKKDLVILLALKWSDDFELNSSDKPNRGLVWIKTTILVLETFGYNDINNTYPITI